MDRLPPVTLPIFALGIFAGTYVLLGVMLGVPTPLKEQVGIVTSNTVRGDANALRDYLESFGGWAPVVSLTVMVVQAALLPIPGFVILFANGLAFGFAGGTVVSLVGFGLSASVCFAVTRALGRRRVEWLARRLGLEAIDRWLARWGAGGVLLLRLAPGFSFDGVSYAAGLTGMRYRRFVVASVLGSTPQTLLFVYLGERATEHLWLILIGGMLVAAAFMATVYRLNRRALAASRR